MRSEEKPRFQKKIRSRAEEMARLSAQVELLEEKMRRRESEGASKTELDRLYMRLIERKNDLFSWGIL